MYLCEIFFIFQTFSFWMSTVSRKRLKRIIWWLCLKRRRKSSLIRQHPNLLQLRMFVLLSSLCRVQVNPRCCHGSFPRLLGFIMTAIYAMHSNLLSLKILYPVIYLWIMKLCAIFFTMYCYYRIFNNLFFFHSLNEYDINISVFFCRKF